MTSAVVQLDMTEIPYGNFIMPIEGIAFLKRGELYEADLENAGLWLKDLSDQSIYPVQHVVREKWTDESYKTVRIVADLVLEPGTRKQYRVEVGAAHQSPPFDSRVLQAINSGEASFEVGWLDGVGNLWKTGPMTAINIPGNHPELKMPETDTWRYFVHEASFGGYMTARVISEWVAHTRLVRFTVQLLNDKDFHPDAPLRINGWKFWVRRFTLEMENNELWEVPLYPDPVTNVENDGSVRWELVPSHIHAFARYRTGMTRQFSGIVEVSGPPAEHTRDLAMASLDARYDLVLLPMLDGVRESNALDANGGPGPRRLLEEHARTIARDDANGYFNATWFGPMGRGSWPWGMLTDPWTAGTPMNRMIAASALWHHGVPKAYRAMRAMADADAMFREAWLRPGFDPYNPPTRGTFATGALAESDRYVDNWDICDDQHYYLPAESYLLALIGRPLHIYNVVNRTKEVLYRWNLGQGRIDASRTLAWRGISALRGYLANPDSIFRGQIRQGMTERAQVILDTYHYDGADLGWLVGEPDYKEHFGPLDITRIDAPWQMNHALCAYVGMLRHTGASIFADACEAILKVMLNYWYDRDEYGPGHDGGTWYWIMVSYYDTNTQQWVNVPRPTAANPIVDLRGNVRHPEPQDPGFFYCGLFLAKREYDEGRLSLEASVVQRMEACMSWCEARGATLGASEIENWTYAFIGDVLGYRIDR